MPDFLGNQVDMTTSGIMVQSDAEKAFYALVEKLLPVSPADLLFMGEFPGVWINALEAQGHKVTGLDWRDQTAYAQPPAGTRHALLQVDLALPETHDRLFDVALIADFTPDVHPLALFDQLDSLLNKDATVLLVGPETTMDSPRLVHWLDYVMAIGKRCGFDVLESSPEGPVNDAPFFVRALRRGTTPRWRISHVLPKDFPEIAQLFEEVFGHSLSRDLWNWKYGAGHGNAVMVRRGDGVLVAHYGGMYRNILLFGKPDWAFQICDVMVHAKERGVLTRQGPFVLAAASCAEIYGPLGYGFPNRRAMLVAEKMGLYAEAGQMAEVRWGPSASGFRLRTRVRHIDFHDAVNEREPVNQLWTQMANDLRDGVVGERNWDYLEQRYFHHPHHQYEVLLVSARFTGRPLGIAVLRRLEASCELLDVIAPLCNLGLVIDQARRLTGHWGLPYLYCWITKNHLPLFLACEGKEEELDISIPTSCWTADPRSEQMKGKWWLMSGDTDFR